MKTVIGSVKPTEEKTTPAFVFGYKKKKNYYYIHKYYTTLQKIAKAKGIGRLS